MDIKNVRLGDICEFINGDRGKNYPSGKDFVANGIPFINAGHIVNNKISFENMNYITKEKYETLGSGKIRKNDILYCLRGSLGKNAIVNINEGAIASSLVILRPKKDIVNIDYLLIYLNSKEIEEQIDKVNNGSSQPNLSAKSVKEFKVFLPSYDFQKNISKRLLKAQELIDKRKEQIEALDELVKSKFIEIFGDPISNPKGFKVKTLQEICENLDKYRVPITASNRSEGNIPYYGASGIVDYVKDYIFDERLLLVSEDGANLLARVTPIAFEINGKTWVNNHAHVLKFNKYSLQKYVEYSINLQDVSQYITGTAQPKLNQAALNKFRIPLPSDESLDYFLQFVKQVDKLKSEMEKSLKELEDNFNSLMQRAFKGELFN